MTGHLSTDQTGLIARLAALPAREQAELLARLDESGAEFGVFPLSASQRRMWLLSQVSPGNSVYHMPFVFRVGGGLDLAALEAAVNDLVARHEALRTVFAVVGGQPRQLVLPELAIRVDVDPAQGGARSEERIAERCAAEARRPFDLSGGPLLRVLLLAPGTATATLVVTLHHIVCDGWSVAVAFDELSRLYTARLGGEAAGLPEPEVQFADFTVWQRARLAGETSARLAEHWRRVLDGAPLLVELPADRTAPPVRSLAGACDVFAWPTELEDLVTRFSRHEGVTAYATLLAAFASVVHRQTGQSDLLIGSPMANRTGAELGGVVGCFVNVVPLRIGFTAQTGFRGLVKAVHETISEAQEHQEYPFEDLVAQLRPDRDLSHDPVVQLLFVLDDSRTDLRLDGADLRPRPVHAGGSVFDFSVTLRRADPERGGGFDGEVEYNTDLFDPATAHRFLGHLRTLLQAAITAPDTPVAQLDLLTGEELELLREWNTTGAPDADGDVPALFEEWALRTPEAPAVVAADGSVSYREAEARANRLAHHLSALGVARASAVGVALDRGPDLAVAFLAVLKAGAVYVPLDSGYPADRLAYMIENAGIEALITRSGLAEVPGTEGVPVVRLDQAEAALAACPATAPERALHPDDAAYVIFTSGSTGKPKGTVVTHRGLRNCALAQRAVLGGGGETVLQFASPSFDASVFEFVLALAHGGALCVASRERLLPGPELAETVRRHAVTAAVLPPTALGVLAPKDLAGISTLMVAGEACPPEVAAAWAPGRRFYNLYGPTEASIWSTYARCDAAQPRPTIGTPVPGTTAHVLDSSLLPVPVGVPGELCVGGAGVTRGYLGRPALTARQFVPDPFSERPGARLYRTGDLVRRLPDGALDYLGRIDRQVKIRGHRIELPEIEAQLERLPGVGRGVVTARAGETGALHLVAYIQPAAAGDGGRLDPGVIRGRLGATLPGFMVPNVVIVLDELPLNGNGKIDHTRLPEPPRIRPAGARVAPVSTLEREIAAAWRDLLGLDEVGVHDNFFDLGGDSLLLAQLRKRLSEQLGREIATLQLFAHPTVHGLAAVLSEPPAGPPAPEPAGRSRGESGANRRAALLARGRRAGDRPDLPTPTIPQ